jgi:Ulp1 family protease
LDVENKIISGHIDSVAGVLHLTNHWTSLIITFRPPKILYGDSLGSSMPSNKASSFRRWVCHMLDRSGQKIPEIDISIYPLAISTQRDPFSCGLFALNAISHHYIPQNSPLLQSTVLSLAHSRLEFALDMLQEDAVS